MGHEHGQSSANKRRLAIAIAIVASVLVLEIVGALVSGSLALLADAGHMASDLIALVVALIAIVVAARPASDRQTFGYQRTEVFAALINGLLLIGVAVWVSIDAISRLLEGDAEVAGPLMLVVGTVGLVANVAAALLLRPAASGSLNMRGAYLEVLGDMLGSVAVVVASIVMIITGFAAADAIASLVIVALIIPRAFALLRDVVRVLSDSVPADTDVAEIRRHIRETTGVVDVHDVHVWSITTGAKVFSAHVVVAPEVFRTEAAGALLDELSACLSTHFDVAHSTFQLEPADRAAHEDIQHA
jgi:cobalt-zinc-cadmium efflux system protein